MKENLKNNFLNSKKLSVIILIAFLLLYNTIAEHGSITWKEFYPDAGSDRNVIVGGQIDFKGTFVNPNNRTVTAKWYFEDDHSIEIGQNVQHVFKKEGTYVVSFEVESKEPYNIKNSDTLHIKVYENKYELYKIKILILLRYFIITLMFLVVIYFILKGKYWSRGAIIGLIFGIFMFIIRSFLIKLLGDSIFIPLICTTPLGVLLEILFGYIPISLDLFFTYTIVPYIGWYFFIGLILDSVYSYFRKKFNNYKIYFILFLIAFILIYILQQYILVDNYTNLCLKN